MPTHHPDATRARRPFAGFHRERAAYERLRPELLDRARGQYVVFVGEAYEGPMETFEDALRAGYRRFGLGPLYVKHVRIEAPVVEITRDVHPCRT